MNDLKYTKEHEWLKLEDPLLEKSKIAYVGITDFAQNELGDIIFIELPKIGEKFEVNDEGRGSFEVDYEDFFVSNGEYTLKTELGSQESTDRVTLDRLADDIRAEVVSFDGVTDNSEANFPIDKDSNINLNMHGCNLCM